MSTYNQIANLVSVSKLITFAQVMFLLVIIGMTYITFKFPTVIKSWGITISILSGLGICSLMLFLGCLKDEAGLSSTTFEYSWFILAIGVVLGTIQILIIAKNTKFH
ncbi:hypothetical protein [Anaerorhabdus furcosa]|uniref:Uncharacterized protein n=1 Tax=Anaerorhabdus furcosa TaxID=118967 RepID=A0A1T4Q667_9FIRM|nr:hypothetical protein [Anaerorhabdus furcosa]SJZ99273.1 hypothetical protein SAMN02745191_2339 [Anaerorhabdus furcosa]